MSSTNLTLTWAARKSKTWYGFSSVGARPSGYSVDSNDCRISAPETSTTNAYTVVFKVTLPNSSSYYSFSTLKFKIYIKDLNTTAGTFYATLSKNGIDSSYTYGYSTIRNNGISNQSFSYSTSSTSQEISFDVSGQSKGQTLYLWLFTNSTGDIYKVDYSATHTATLTYTAQYTVSYNNGGYGTAPSSQKKIEGSALTLQPFISNQSSNSYVVDFNSNGGSTTPSSITSKTVRKQSNWKDSNGNTYTSKGSYTTNAATTMTATWGNATQQSITLPAAISKDPYKPTYTISYNSNNPNTDSSTSSTPASQTLTRVTTYSFKNWAKDSASSTTVYSAEASFTPTANTTMYATWNTVGTTGSVTLANAMTKGDTTSSGYKITFNANGGTCATKETTVTNTIKWTFTKWNTKSDGSGTSYDAGSNYAKSAKLTLYAQWSNSIKTYGSVNLPTPTRTGYKFLGWAESADATTGTTGSYQPSKNITLYAIWKPDGGVRIYLKDYGEYKIALVYVYTNNKWNLTIPYMYDKNQNQWKILGG